MFESEVMNQFLAGSSILIVGLLAIKLTEKFFDWQESLSSKNLKDGGYLAT